MMFIRRMIVLFFFCSGSMLLSGQDIHFSQFMTSPLMLNPATTGFFNGTYRLALNGKNQWQAVTKPYQTMSLGFDMSPIQRRYHRDAFGAGILINADIAGDSKFSTTAPSLSLSYIRSLNRRGSQMLSVGLMAGWVFRSINYSALHFDNQFNGSYYDPDLANNEDFSLRNYNYFDLGTGIHWHYQISRESSAYAGLGVFHLLKPKQSFMDDNSIRLDVKWSGYAGAQFSVSQTVDLLPQFLFLKQGPYREVLIGARAKYMKNRYSPMEYASLNVGIFYRNKDAMVFMTGFDYKGFEFGLSYDMNVSALKPASYYKGGLEFSLIYMYSKFKHKRRREIPCPIF
jgi:type IX secretion system PorP/SprF family membrane protein